MATAARDWTVARRLLTSIGSAGLAITGMACAEVMAPELPGRDDSPIQTDSLVYHLARLKGEYRAWAIATYRNTSGSPVYFARCNPSATTPMFGARRTGSDSTKTFFSDYAWACVGGVPTGQIAPGESVTVKVPLGSLDQPAMYPPLRPEHLIGLLRVEMELCTRFEQDSDDCIPLPQRARQSNAFGVTY